jgi:mannose-6-phosphate isomerase
MKGLDIIIKPGIKKTIALVNKYFSVEILDIDGEMEESADGDRFYIYICAEGSGKVLFGNGSISLFIGQK